MYFYRKREGIKEKGKASEGGRRFGKTSLLGALYYQALSEWGWFGTEGGGSFWNKTYKESNVEICSGPVARKKKEKKRE